MGKPVLAQKVPRSNSTARIVSRLSQYDVAFKERLRWAGEYDIAFLAIVSVVGAETWYPPPMLSSAATVRVRMTARSTSGHSGFRPRPSNSHDCWHRLQLDSTSGLLDLNADV